MSLLKQHNRAELSWAEIGKIGLKSAKDFVKGLFCDEDGFSVKRTLTTLGTTAAFAAVSAIPVVGVPIALASGAVLGSYTAYKGAGKIIDGCKEYYNATTHEEATKAMEKAMDGGVETGVSILALLGIKQYATKMSGKAASGTKAQPVEQTQVRSSQSVSSGTQQAQVKPVKQTQAQSSQSVSSGTQQAQVKPVEHVKINDTNKLAADESAKVVNTKVDAKGRITQKTTQYNNGHKVEKFYNKSGSISKEIRTDVNGKKMTVEYKYDKKGFDVISKTETYEPGYIYQSNPLKTYSKGMIKESSWENGLRKEVCTDGDALTTNWYNRHNEIIKQECSIPDKYGRIGYEKTRTGYKETFADGRTFEANFDNRGGDYITRFIDGSSRVRHNALIIQT